MNRYEKLIAFVLVLLMCAMVTYLKISNIMDAQGDSAIFMQVTENIAFRGIPISNVFANTQGFLDSKLTILKAEDASNATFSTPIPSERNYFDFHKYYILYFIAPFCKIFSTGPLLMALQVFSFFGMVLLAYYILRKNKIGRILSTLICVVIMSHPAWSEAIKSQFYPDRFFVFFGFWLMYEISKEHPNLILVALSGICCAAVNERGFLIAGIVLISYALLYWKKANKAHIPYLGIGLILVLGYFILTKFCINNNYYSSFLDLHPSSLFSLFTDKIFINKLLLFLLFDIVLFGIIGIFNIRIFIISFITMMPNILGNIGGAEKVGWSTHYHSYYFPFIAFAFIMGSIQVIGIYYNPKRAKIIYASFIISILLLLTINPYQYSSLEFSYKNVARNVILNTVVKMPVYINGYAKVLNQYRTNLINAVPEGSTVSMPEGVMSILYKNRTVHYFPMGIDTDDYAILSIVSKKDSNIKYGGVISYLGQANTDKLNAYVVERMKKIGYDFDNPTLIEPLGIAIIKRN